MIPIVCSFNDDYAMPAIVFLTSLSKNAAKTTTYKVFVLYSSQRLQLKNINLVKELGVKYSNLNFEFIDVKDSFIGAFESKHLTVDAYYRLLIPELIDEKKVIYIDVDTIVNEDLFPLYDVDLEGKMLLGVKDILTKKQKKYQLKIGNEPNEYINSGVIVFDIDRIREKGMQSHYKDYLMQNFENHDQDIINLVYNGSIMFVSNMYNYTFQHTLHNETCEKPYILHYTIFKPWLYYSAFSDVWWRYYKESIVYNYRFYEVFQKKNYKNLNRHVKIGKFFEAIGLYRLLDLIFPN